MLPTFRCTGCPDGSSHEIRDSWPPSSEEIRCNASENPICAFFMPASHLIDTRLASHRVHYVNLRTCAIGCTFEFTFILPKPANSGNTRPKKPKATNSSSKTGAGTTKHKKATKPASPRLTQEQKRERDRVRATDKRQRSKELGLCKHCPAKPIKGQTRCPSCAARHRQYNDNFSPKRRAARTAAQQNKSGASLPPSNDRD